MARLAKWRRVAFVPQVTCFTPAGVPERAVGAVCLSVEEVEAIRLKDLQGLDQERSARSMRISRGTFGRVLESARRKVADALVNGKAIRIEGGNFELATRHFRCLNGHEWTVPFEVMIASPPQFCPTCNTPNIMPTQPLGFGLRWGRHGGRRR